ncbi:MAG: UDP-glucose dehydrogenase family protein [Candidatus Saccharimonadales bacterium]
MKIAVIGTGYVGLVTGTCLAESGHDVICMDIDKRKVGMLNKGEIPIYEPGLPELVKKNREDGRLWFTADLQDLGEPQAIFFALPTPPNGDGEADLSYVLSAAKDVASLLKGYTVLINKSTVPVGTAQKVHAVVSANTKVAFDVVSNPEFLKEGSAVADFMRPDRIVVGTKSKKALVVLEDIYRPFTDNGVPLISMDSASSEMTKYAANSFIAMKISFMNEVANLCELVGADVEAVKRGIGPDPRIGNRYISAGTGYGGSCFPKDVMALEKIAHRNDYDFRILKAVMEVNAKQKQVLVNKVITHYGENLSGITFAIWGLAFKPNSDDIREAPSIEIIRELVGRGAAIQAYDPEAVENTKRVFSEEDVTYEPTALEALQGANALLLVTEWKEFATVKPGVLVKKLKDKLVFDGRNVFTPDTMAKAGLTYISIGRKTVGK